MNLSRHAIALLGSVAMLGGTAMAAPPLIGGSVHAGAAGNIGVGAPPVGVPPVNVPHPVNVPPVNVPKPNVPQPNANARANANVNARANTQVTTGTLTAINGDTITVRLSNGSTQTYNVSSQTASQLRAMLGKPVAYRLVNGVFTIAGHEGNGPLHGTVSSVSGTTALVRLANGTTQSFNVTAQQAAWLKAHAGKSIVFWTSANGSLELNASEPHNKTH
jgi:hypothetical protein